MIANVLPLSLQNNPRLDRWLAILPGGRVRLSVGKVELGQGIMTALAQIAAEELSLELPRLDIVAGDTDAAPDEGMTTGSMSIEVSGTSVRIVCAEAHSLFIEQAARTLGCATAEISVQDGAVHRAGKPTGQDYWTLAPTVSFDREVTGDAPTKPRTQYRVVGTAAPRLDLPAKIHGAGFIHDLSFPGMMHARVLRQPRPDATLATFDIAWFAGTMADEHRAPPHGQPRAAVIWSCLDPAAIGRFRRPGGGVAGRHYLPAARPPAQAARARPHRRETAAPAQGVAERLQMVPQPVPGDVTGVRRRTCTDDGSHW